MANKLENNLTEGKVFGQLLRFAWPMLLANLLQTLYSVVDTIVVGQLDGSIGISAVTIGSQMMFLLTTVGMGFCNGGQIIISQLMGVGDRSGLKQSIGALFSISLISGAVIGVLGVVFVNPVLHVLKTPADVWDQAKAYMVITSSGLIFTFLYNAQSAIMRGLGDSTRPLVFIAIASIANIILDIIFVGPMRMGAMGAAIATIAAQAISMVFGFVYLFRRREHFAFDFKPESFRIHKRWAKELVRMGVPMMIQFSAINISIGYVLRLVNVYGVAASATVGVGGKIVNIFCMPFGAMGTAASAMAGQNMGAGKTERVKTIVNITLAVNMFIFLISVIVSVFFPEEITMLFDDDPEVIELCRIYLQLHIINNFFQALFTGHNAACVGAGNAMLATIAFLTDGVVLRLTLCLLFTYVFNWGLWGIFLATAVAPVGAAVILGGYYYSGKWKTYGERQALKLASRS